LVTRGLGGLGLIGATTAILIVCMAKTAKGQSTESSVPRSDASAHTVRMSANQTAGGAEGDTVTFTSSNDDEHLNSFRQAPKHFLLDQKAMWESPTQLRFADIDWLLPFAAVTGGLLATDTWASRSLSNSLSFVQHSRDFSNGGVAFLGGVGGGLYLWGKFTRDEHKRETGFLAGEAAVDSLVMNRALSYAAGRESPFQDDYRGRFWQGGTSFPSDHAAVAWSTAGIIAHEYPSPFVKLLAYGLAAGVSGARVTGKEHFPSDVLVGSALGWFTAQYVYRSHHDPQLPGGSWQTYAERFVGRGEGGSGSVGSPYVPLDSWIYPALDRLAAIGYINTEFLGMRPWTRLECAQLADQAGDAMGDFGSVSPEVVRIHQELEDQFRDEEDALSDGSNESLRLESMYTRVTGINGQPLNDSYHFGQTIINDFGRPYEEGFNNITGFSGWGTAGRYTIYVRGEYQRAPSAPAYSPAVENAIASMDLNPLQPSTPIASVSQFQLLDTYVSATFANWNFAFGKQSLWWGPGDGGAFLFSDNAEPIYMFRGSRVTPFQLPWIFHLLGPLKVDAFFGKLSGNDFPPRPLVHGEKISFKPTPNVELGFSRTAEFGGVGRPLTLLSLFRSYTMFTSGAGLPANATPGKRTGGFDFSYRVPYLRNWLTVYADSISDDDPSPLAAPRRAGMNPGIYMPRLPHLPKEDVRVEAVYTKVPATDNSPGRFIYYDSFYHDLYTNEKNLIGNWIGRDGTGVQAWTTYWAGARDSIEVAYRHSTTAPGFVPDGGNLTDGSVSVSWWVHSDWNLSTSVQYERWNIPVLAPVPQSNWTTSIEIGFWPKEEKRARQQ
jgi:membrane-associated phospholipid phosphatase